MTLMVYFKWAEFWHRTGMGTSQNSRLALRKVFEGNVAARVLSGRDDLFGSLVGNFKEPYYSPARRKHRH